MLKVIIENGDKEPMELHVNDLGDVATVQQSILREYQEVQKQDFKFDEERLLDMTPFNDMGEFEDWIDKLHKYDYWDMMDKIPEMVELQDCLEASDYDSIDEMTERIDALQSAINDIQDTVRYL